MEVHGKAEKKKKQNKKQTKFNKSIILANILRTSKRKEMGKREKTTNLNSHIYSVFQ